MTEEEDARTEKLMQQVHRQEIIIQGVDARLRELRLKLIAQETTIQELRRQRDALIAEAEGEQGPRMGAPETWP